MSLAVSYRLTLLSRHSQPMVNIIDAKGLFSRKPDKQGQAVKATSKLVPRGFKPREDK